MEIPGQARNDDALLWRFRVKPGMTKLLLRINGYLWTVITTAPALTLRESLAVRKKKLITVIAGLTRNPGE
jgi:hypothetical protein